MFIGHRQGQIFRYRPRVNPDVNDHWLCDYGRFSYERYETDRVVVPKVRNEDDYLGISTWTEALDTIERAFQTTTGDKIAVIASANMTNEEAYLAKQLFAGRLGAKSIGVTVDPIGPIKMKSRSEWLLGTQAAPNFRGVQAILANGGQSPAPVQPPVQTEAGLRGSDDRGAEASVLQLLDGGADGIDILYICDAEFSERAKDPAVLANLRKARLLIVHAWDANHPLTEIADVVLPATIHAEKDGTFTNLQGRVQRVNMAFPPKGQAATDLEIFRRIGAKLFPSAPEFRTADVFDIFEGIRSDMPEMAEAAQ
jgi:NADH-quinone oxidoreductase subunit G